MMGERSPRRVSRWVIALGIGFILAIVVAIGVAMFVEEQGPPAAEQSSLDSDTELTGRPLTAQQRAVDFRRARLQWEVFPERKAIAGAARLTLRVERPIDHLEFDLDPRYEIEELTVGAVPATWSKQEGRLVVSLGRRYAAGETLEVLIRYAGEPHVARLPPWDGGFVWSETPDGEPWIATAVQGEGCDLFWPCFDNASVEIDEVETHVIVPEGLVAPGNGRLLGVDELDDGRRRYRWLARSPNSYAIAINAAPYELLEADYESRYGNNIPMRFWHLPGNAEKAEGLFAEWPDIIAFFEDTIGPYPFGDEKLAAVETPHLGMEHQTLNAYGNDYKKDPHGYDWLFQHEVAHEWFGNQLTNRDWDHFWLHEGFGQYMQPLYTRWKNGEQAYHAEMFRIRQLITAANPMVTGQNRTAGEVYDPATGPGQDIYYKGAWMLHTLRHLIGDEAFFAATRRLVYGRPDPRPGNFEPRFSDSEEFIRLAEEEAGHDLGWFFDTYLRAGPLPTLGTARAGNRLRVQWQVPGDTRFPMPVEVRIDGQTRTLDMSDGGAVITLPRDDAHVLLDPEAKILRRLDATDDYRRWQGEQARPQ